MEKNKIEYNEILKAILLSIVLFVLSVMLYSLISPTLAYNDFIGGNISLLVLLLLFVVLHLILIDIFQEKPKFISYFRFNAGFSLFIVSSFIIAFTMNTLTDPDPSSSSDINVELGFGIFLTLALMGFYIYLKEAFREKDKEN